MTQQILPDNGAARKPRRMARTSDPQTRLLPDTTLPRRPGKIDQIEALLRTPGGASIAELVAATGWQPHSVRGAIAGALKKRGLAICSDRIEGLRRYRVVAA